MINHKIFHETYPSYFPVEDLVRCLMKDGEQCLHYLQIPFRLSLVYRSFLVEEFWTQSLKNFYAFEIMRDVKTRDRSWSTKVQSSCTSQPFCELKASILFWHRYLLRIGGFRLLFPPFLIRWFEISLRSKVPIHQKTRNGRTPLQTRHVFYVECYHCCLSRVVGRWRNN